MSSKRLALFLVVLASLSGCGPSAEQKAKDDKERLDKYQAILDELKSTPNPSVDNNFDVVTAEDLQASANREAGSSTAYGSSSYSASTSSSDYNSKKHVHDRQYFSDEYNKAAYEASAAEARGDSR